MFALAGKAGGESGRIYVIFYVHKNISIKSTEMMQRGSDDGVVFANSMPGYIIKQWKHLLFCTSSKIKLVPFMVEDWKRPNLKEKLEG